MIQRVSNIKWLTAIYTIVNHTTKVRLQKSAELMNPFCGWVSFVGCYISENDVNIIFPKDVPHTTWSITLFSLNIKFMVT